MIEEGLVRLIQANIGSLAPGGYPGTLPKDFTGTAYYYRSITRKRGVGLLFTSGLTYAVYEFECVGPTPLAAQTLAYAVDAALNGFQGNMSDPDSTYVSSCYQTDWIGPTELDPAARNQRVLIEYEIWYAG